MQEPSIWKIQNCNGADYLVALLQFLLTEFSRIFGSGTMFAEECVVFNDQGADCPMLIINLTPVRIRLAQPDLSFWAQTIFQLSHELCHYAIRQHKINKEFTLSWFEEIVCEAMSLYALQWSAENWKDCSLSLMNPQFSNAIKRYLEEELKAEGNDVFQKCETFEMLVHYEKEHSTDRPTHKNERNQLYFEIAKNPAYCLCVCDYHRYIEKNGITIDFERWEMDNPCALIKFLHSLQPCSSMGV